MPTVGSNPDEETPNSVKNGNKSKYSSKLTHKNS
jgi:hypothetical protein